MWGPLFGGVCWVLSITEFVWYWSFIILLVIIVNLKLISRGISFTWSRLCGAPLFGDPWGANAAERSRTFISFYVPLNLIYSYGQTLVPASHYQNPLGCRSSSRRRFCYFLRFYLEILYSCIPKYRVGNDGVNIFCESHDFIYIS